MNKKNYKNDTTQHSRGKDFRPLSRESTGGRSKTLKHSYIPAPDSTINFVVNVSSSGTNLSRKIEREMAKLDNVETKLRNHRCKAKAICSSVKSPSSTEPKKRKLRNVLNNMLTVLDSIPQKPTKVAKARIGEQGNPNLMKKSVKLKKCSPNVAVIDSLTNINRSKKVVPKSVNVKKSALKKPSSAPVGTRNALADDLRFAENLKLGRGVDLHFTLSEVKKLSEQKEHRSKNDSDIQRTLNSHKIVIEKCKNNVSYVYDTTSLKYIDPRSLQSIAVPEFTNSNPKPGRAEQKKSETHPKHHQGMTKEKLERMGTLEKKKLEEDEEKSVTSEKVVEKEKPERKKIYSFLRKSNFTISQHSEDAGTIDSKERNDSEKETRFSVNEESVEVEEDEGKGDDRITKDKFSIKEEKSVEIKSQEDDQATVPIDEKVLVVQKKSLNSEKFQVNSGSICPADLLESSILAVQNVLRTIDSMTKQFSIRSEIKDPYFGDEDILGKMEDSLDVLKETSIDQLWNNVKEDSIGYQNKFFQDLSRTKKADQRCAKDDKERIHEKVGTNIPVSKIIPCKNKSPIDEKRLKSELKGSYFKNRTELKQTQNKVVLCLKQPIKSFFESEENFGNTVENSESLTKFTKIKAHNEEDIEPLKKALNSLRQRVHAIKDQVIVDNSRKNNYRPCSAPTNLSCISVNISERSHSVFKRGTFVNDSFTRKLFSDSCQSSGTNACSCCTKQHSNSFSWSSDESKTNSYKSVNSSLKSSKNSHPHYPKRILKKLSNLKTHETSRIFKKSYSKRMKVLPEYNFEKCLFFLRKKFKDFENCRKECSESSFSELDQKSTSKRFSFNRRTISKISRKTKKKESIITNNNRGSMRGSRKCIDGKKHYELCFKNENFNYCSNTSCVDSESDGKIREEIVKTENFNCITKAQSSPD